MIIETELKLPVTWYI